MRRQSVLAVVALSVVGGWLLFQPRSNSPDLVVARDRLMASDAVVATFSPGATEGYRFTSLKNRGWVWERTSGSTGEGLPDAIIYNGSTYLLRLAEGCFIQLPPVQVPLVPGLTVSQRLVNQPGLHDTAGTLFAYTVDGARFGRGRARAAVPVDVTEDLAPLRSGGVLHASTGDVPGPVWPGTYAIREATSSERQSAEWLLSTAMPSDYAELVIEERIVGTTILNNSILGPYRIVIAQACPAHPTLLSAGVDGGQVEGLRSSVSPIRFSAGPPAAIEQAVETELKFKAPVEAFNLVAATSAFGPVPVTSTRTIIARIGDGGYLGVQIDSCTSKPWFVC